MCTISKESTNKMATVDSELEKIYFSWYFQSAQSTLFNTQPPRLNVENLYSDYVIVIPWSPGIYHGNHLIPRAQPEGEVYFSVINPWLPWYKCYPAPDWPSPYLYSYIATDLRFNNDLELCSLVLSVSSVSVCATGLTALDARTSLSASATLGHTPKLNMTFNRKSKADVNHSRSRAPLHSTDTVIIQCMSVTV